MLLVAEGAGGLTLALASGTITGNAKKTIAQGEALWLKYVAFETWVVVGGTSA